MGITLTFNLPPKALSSNGSYGNRHEHAAAVEGYRNECRMFVRQAVNALVRQGATEYANRAVLSMTLWCGKARVPDGRTGFRDVQNAMSATKALVDAVVLEGVLYDDDANHLTWGNVAIVRPKDAVARREIVLIVNYDRSQNDDVADFDESVGKNRLRRLPKAEKSAPAHK